MAPLISIIVPIFNSENYLSDCVDSIINQTYKKTEIILVNDGSTDDSLEICRKYVAKYKRVKLINQPNQGVSSARNSGIGMSRGEFIGFVDSDDTIEPDMYEKLIENISDGDDASVLVLNSVKKSELQNNEVEKIDSKEALLKIFKLQLPASQCAYLYRASTLNNLKAEEDIHFFEDFLFNVNFISRSNKLNLCKYDLYNYRLNLTSINHQQINEKKMSCLKIYDRVSSDLELKDKLELKNAAQYFRTHFLISMILSLSKSDIPNKNLLVSYVNRLQVEAEKMLSEVMASREVLILYKIVIVLMSKYPEELLKVIRLVKYKK